MPWLHLFAYFWGGACLANAVPHLTAGVTGRPFQSPFANPPGQGLSSSTVNVLWAFANLLAAYALLCRVGDFDARAWPHIAAASLGALALSLFAARHFGRFHGGNTPEHA
jgi:hypothetical protein